MMDELNLTDFQHGGVNITGFRVVVPEAREVQQTTREWRALRPDKFWSAGPDTNITVSFFPAYYGVLFSFVLLLFSSWLANTPNKVNKTSPNEYLNAF